MMIYVSPGGTLFGFPADYQASLGIFYFQRFFVPFSIQTKLSIISYSFPPITVTYPRCELRPAYFLLFFFFCLVKKNKNNSHVKHFLLRNNSSNNIRFFARIICILYCLIELATRNYVGTLHAHLRSFWPCLVNMVGWPIQLSMLDKIERKKNPQSQNTNSKSAHTSV